MAQSLDFQSISAQPRLDLVKNREGALYRVPLNVARLESIAKQLPEADSSIGMEVPPTPIALSDAAAFQIYGSSADDAAGAWQRFVVFAYRHGARIYYRRLDSSTVEAEVSFLPR